LAGGIAAALYKQQKTGKGDKVMISLYGDSVWSLGSMLLGLQANKNLSYPKSRKDAPPLVTTYQCSDGNWLSLTMFEWERFFPVVCKLLGLDELVSDPRFRDVNTGFENRATLIPRMEEKFKLRSSAEWDKLFRENDLPHSLLTHMKDILTDEQAKANNYIYRVTTRKLGDFLLPAPPVQIGGNFAPDYIPAPLLGEHTAEVLKECGYTDEQIKEFSANGAIKCHG
jgi:crotonobetainyl-CoA:carnitine CoA-transferase CaiB-like acyl-CoA transferase